MTENKSLPQNEKKSELNSTEKNSETNSGKNKSLVSSGISLSILTLFSRIMGLLREITKAKFLGTTILSDAFGIAFQIPNLFRRLFAENSISVAFIPTFKGYLEEYKTPETRQTTQEFINATFTLVSFLTASFVSVGILAAPLILRIYYDAETVKAMKEAVVLTRIMFPYLFVISIAAFFQGILNGLKIFAPSGFTPILFNGIVVLATYLLSPYTANPARAMAFGVITGGFVQAFFQFPFVVKNNWRITFTSLKKAFTNPGTKKVIALVVPTIFGMACYQVNDLVSSALANRAGEGVVSSLGYSLRLQELILGVFAVSISTVILPDLSGFAKNKNWVDFKDLVSQSMKIIALISIPVTFYSFVMGENLITLVFSTGKFDSESVKMTLGIFRFHIAGLFFIAANRILSPAFYAQSNAKLPTLAGIINFAVNIILAFIFVKAGYFSKTVNLRGQGIAFALTLSSAVNTVLLFVFLKKTNLPQPGTIAKSTIVYCFKMIILSVVATVPVVLLRPKLLEIFAGHNRFVSQGIPVLITAIIFAAVGVLELIVTKDSVVMVLIRKLKRK